MPIYMDGSSSQQDETVKNNEEAPVEASSLCLTAIDERDFEPFRHYEMAKMNEVAVSQTTCSETGCTTEPDCDHGSSNQDDSLVSSNIPNNEASEEAQPHASTSTSTSSTTPTKEHEMESSGRETPREDTLQSTQLTTLQIVTVMASLCASLFVAALDITIVATVLPIMAHHFQSSQIYTWIGSAYALAHTSTTTSWGMLSDIWGRKPVLLFSIGVFFLGSLMCALVESPAAFIAGRSVQGAGAGGLTTLGSIVISDLFSLRNRGLYFGIMSVVWAFACGMGPVLGGVFAERLTWRWCFYINLPISGSAFLLLVFALHLENPRTPIWEGLKAIDWFGTMLVVAGTVMFLLGLTFGGIVHPWGSSIVICLIIFGLITIGLFICNEWKFAEYPAIPLRLLRGRTSPSSFAVGFFHSFVLMGIAFYIPLYSQAVLGEGPLMAGVYLLPFVVGICASGAATALYIQRTGKYIIPVQIGTFLTILGTGLLISLPVDAKWVRLSLYQFVAAVGLGLNVETVLLSLQASVAQSDVAAATSTMTFVRALSAAISIVVGGVVFQNEMERQGPSLTAKLGANLTSNISGNKALENISLINDLPGAQRLVVRQAIHEALRIVWVMYTVIAALCAFAGMFVRVHALSKSHTPSTLGLAVRKGRRESKWGSDRGYNRDSV